MGRIGASFRRRKAKRPERRSKGPSTHPFGKQDSARSPAAGQSREASSVVPGSLRGRDRGALLAARARLSLPCWPAQAAANRAGAKSQFRPTSIGSTNMGLFCGFAGTRRQRLRRAPVPRGPRAAAAAAATPSSVAYFATLQTLDGAGRAGQACSPPLDEKAFGRYFLLPSASKELLAPGSE